MRERKHNYIPAHLPYQGSRLSIKNVRGNLGIGLMLETTREISVRRFIFVSSINEFPNMHIKLVTK